MTAPEKRLFKRRKRYKIFLVPYFRSETGMLVELAEKDASFKIDFIHFTGPPLMLSTDSNVVFEDHEFKRLFQDLMDGLLARSQTKFSRDSRPLSEPPRA